MSRVCCCTAAARAAAVAVPLGPNCTRDEGELADDWLATLVRGALRATAGSAAPRDAAWPAIKRRLEDDIRASSG